MRTAEVVTEIEYLEIVDFNGHLFVVYRRNGIMSATSYKVIDIEESRREEERRKRPDVQHYKPGAFSSRRPDPEDWRDARPEERQPPDRGPVTEEIPAAPVAKRSAPEELFPGAAAAFRGQHLWNVTVEVCWASVADPRISWQIPDTYSAGTFFLGAGA